MSRFYLFSTNFGIDSNVNPQKVDELRPALVSFLAFDHNKSPGIAGTGFIVAGMPDYALIITAKHVLSEGVLKKQQPVSRYHPSAIFVPDSNYERSSMPK